MMREVLKRLQDLETRLARVEASPRAAAGAGKWLVGQGRLIKVTGRIADAANKYEVDILDVTTPTTTATGSLSMPEGVAVRTEPTKGIGIDVSSNGLGGHQIGTSRFPVYRLGLLCGWANTNEQRPIVAFSNADPGVFLVNLSKDGGDDGDGDSEPTYTYTVTRDGTELGTGKSPSVGRTEGSFGEASLGLGCYVSGEFTLLQAFERPETYECEEEE